MITYIVSHHFSQVVSEVIEECNLNILSSHVEAKISFSIFIRQQLSQLQNTTILLLDLSCFTDTDEEIIMALSSFRMVYDNAKVIILASNREVGDPLLSEIFSLAIYDIIIPSDSMKEMKDELLTSINIGKTYKDSIPFKITGDFHKAKTNKSFGKEVVVKEKVIIKNEIKSSVNKAIIGFVGTQKRIGVTHNAVVSGYFLKEQGYRIAIVENSSKVNKCFQDIKESFEIDHEGEDYFSLNNIDFYMDFDLRELHRILSKNYNFVIIDFGLFQETDTIEFSRCVKQIMVCGSKPWELDKMNDIFTSTEPEILKDYIFLFNFTDLSNSAQIKEGMDELKNVYFTEYTPDPFNSSYFADLRIIFKEYLIEKTETELHNKKFSFNKIKKRILKK